MQILKIKFLKYGLSDNQKITWYKIEHRDTETQRTQRYDVLQQNKLCGLCVSVVKIIPARPLVACLSATKGDACQSKKARSYSFIITKFFTEVSHPFFLTTNFTNYTNFIYAD